MVTVEEAAKILKCSKANIYQRLKAGKVKTKRATKEMSFMSTRRTSTMIFDLDDLLKK